jgi:hypothetical protein
MKKHPAGSEVRIGLPLASIAKGFTMFRITRALRPALALPAIGLLVAAPERGSARSDGAELHAQGMAWQANDVLPPADIRAEVRREGFHPVGRPALRGSVYALYAVDQDDFDVQLTVDAATGRVLWITDAVAHFGGPGSYGHRSVWRVLAPVPPVATAAPVARNRTGAARQISMKRLLPPVRPAGLSRNAPAVPATAAPGTTEP